MDRNSSTNNGCPVLTFDTNSAVDLFLCPDSPSSQPHKQGPFPLGNSGNSGD